MANLDDLKYLRQIDKSNMLGILLDLPAQCNDAVGIASRFEIPDSYKAAIFDEVFFTGLGGSAIGGDIVKTYLSGRLKIPVIVNRGYDAPAFVDKKTLAFVVSYSGNTEETLSAYGQAKAKGANIIIITSGGALGELAVKDAAPHIFIPRGIPPRTAIGYMALIPLCALSGMGAVTINSADLAEVVRILEELREEALSPKIKAPVNIAKLIAGKLYGRFVIIYGAEDFLAGVVTRYRQELEENSKIVCSSSVLPEMNHNEITGWEDPGRIGKDFAVIILRDKDEHPRVRRRMEISKELLARRARHVIEIPSRGSSLLARTFSLIYIGAFISFYLAVLNGVDPTPVDNVTYLKKQLAK